MQRTFYAEQAALQAEVDAVGRDAAFKLRHGYRQPCASGNDVFDVPGSNLIYADDVFLDVLESPRVLELVLQIIGQDVSAVEYSARTVPPDGEGGYTEWSVSLCLSISLSFSVALTLCVLWWSQASRLRKCLRLAASGLAGLRLRLTHRYVCARARAHQGRHNSGPQWQWQYDHPMLSEDVKLFVRMPSPILRCGQCLYSPRGRVLCAGNDQRPTARSRKYERCVRLTQNAERPGLSWQLACVAVFPLPPIDSYTPDR